MGWFSDVFGDKPADTSSITQGEQEYQQRLQEALQNLQRQQAQGRGDITQAGQEALAYGEPYREAGAGALQAYQGSLGLGGAAARQKALEAFHTGPAYQFALRQGITGVQRGEAAGGLRGSGAEQKALTSYSQGLANQEYGGYQQRLASLAGMGQQASQQAAQERMMTGSQLAQLGLGYSGQETPVYGQMGQAAAEAGMAKSQMQAQQEASRRQFWGNLIGTVGGLAAPFIGGMFGGGAAAAKGAAGRGEFNPDVFNPYRGGGY